MNRLCLFLLVVAAGICSESRCAETYCVSLEGKDTNDGRTEKTAWRTIAYAAKQAKAGDTVLVAPGDYGAEQVVFANSGEEGKPIVFKGNGGRPKLKSDDKKAKAFLVEGKKSHIRIENFEFAGYEAAVSFCKGASQCWARDLRCFGSNGVAIGLSDDVHHCWVDNCFVADNGWNGIMIYSDPGDKGRWNRKPCTFNAITNCVVVRGGHSSFDVHTACPDSYVVGCLAREKGKDRDGKGGACGFYLHNFDVPRMRVVGNAVTECYWGIALTGGSDCIIADNLVCGNSRGITLDRGERWGAYDAGTDCAGNALHDNIVFDVKLEKDWVYAVALAGATGSIFMRNYADKQGREYSCNRYRNADPAGNRIVDPLNGRNGIQVTEGSFALSYSAGFNPGGTQYRLTSNGKADEKTAGAEGASFGTLGKGSFVTEAIAPAGEITPPQHLRVAALPSAEGGAAVVWGDWSSGETGFSVERRLADEKEFKEIAKLEANATRYLDKEVGRRKAFYRVRALYGDKQSGYSNEDEVVRYGYWFTDRTGLAVDGTSAFAQVEKAQLKTLIVEKTKRVERKADAEEGVSAFALLEAVAPDAKAGESLNSVEAKREAKVWLVASKPVTATLRWRAGWIRGSVEGEGEYTLELDAGGRKVKACLVNGKPTKATLDEKTRLVRLDVAGSGYLEAALE
jgi:parallel beta-helix repeat protein